MTKVVIANGWTEPRTGKSYKPGQTAEVEAPVARHLLKTGLARACPDEPAAETSAPAPKPEPAKKEASK